MLWNHSHGFKTPRCSFTNSCVILGHVTLFPWASASLSLKHVKKKPTCCAVISLNVYCGQSGNRWQTMYIYFLFPSQCSKSRGHIGVTYRSQQTFCRLLRGSQAKSWLWTPCDCQCQREGHVGFFLSVVALLSRLLSYLQSQQNTLRLHEFREHG